MSLTVEEHGHILIVRMEDPEIGADNAQEIKDELMPHLERHPFVAVDLSQVGFMDSSGLSLIVALLKAVRQRGALRLFGVQSRVKELFRLTRLDGVFAMDPGERASLTVLEDFSRKRKLA